MLLPIGDDNSDRQLTPIVNYGFILLNIFVFIYFQHWGTNTRFLFAYAAVPAEILSGHDIVTHAQILRDAASGQQVEIPGLQPTPIPIYLTIFTAMFMHGSIAHIAGNMLYLWIFGDNLENVMGHKNYFFFYLLCGLLATLSHVFSTYYFQQGAYLPSLGASGAIAGVLGGYILLFPGRRVRVWILFWIIGLPSIIVVGLWFVFQLISGKSAISHAESDSIAYAAHIGGFIFGLLLVKLFVQPQRVVARPRRRTFF